MPSAAERRRVAVLWHGDPAAPPPPEETRYARIFETLEDAGLKPEPVVYADSAIEAVRARLLACDAVLVWVNPIMEDGHDRSRLDPLLREVAATGVWVTSHPGTILKLGTKDVLVTTKDMAWGADAHRYRTLAELRAALPARLEAGPRVLKRHRGNGGGGTWKVELAPAQAPGRTRVRVLHAERGSHQLELPFNEFLDLMRPYFEAGGFMVDQPYAPRLADGMVRAYLVRDRVAGFGRQRITALLPLEAGATSNPAPPPREYFGPDPSDLQPLRLLLEGDWLPELQRRLDLDRDALPAIWDIDFLYGPPDEHGHDTYVLCEINVSSVFPFPDEALAPLAAEVARTLAARHPSG